MRIEKPVTFSGYIQKIGEKFVKNSESSSLGQRIKKGIGENLEGLAATLKGEPRAIERKRVQGFEPITLSVAALVGIIAAVCCVACCCGICCANAAQNTGRSA